MVTVLYGPFRNKVREKICAELCSVTSCPSISKMVEARTPNSYVDYCRNLQCVPNISFGDIEAFSSRGPAKRDHDRGYNYFAEKYLFNVQDFQALSKRLKSSKTRMTQAMKDGIANEPLAAEAYSNIHFGWLQVQIEKCTTSQDHKIPLDY
ncbi:uncharacterized protein LOC112566230 isoform X2 [Pomacea canaliculata]|uniref:uncharacterized protein LOC112566230 isoform X2 n=1 Tax=Pomacea canaliculata TaxID=400727 RepID=UPI000D735627|nr:uncharacterized protein LOC112566230 isoform X2 [Pomacea canaliculata]